MTDQRPEGHAFISYVHEDSAAVDRLQSILEAAGIRVWRDTEDLWPGQDWRIEISKAITQNSLVFLACFSHNSNAREISYQNEELILAVEQMRQRKPGRPWLIPIRFSDCTLPHFDLGASRTLDNIQRVDLFDGSWDRGGARLAVVIHGILSNRSQPIMPQPLDISTAAKPVSIGPAIKAMLLNPSRQIELEDLIDDTTSTVKKSLTDESLFPVTSDQLAINLEGARFVVAQAKRYEKAIEPLIEALITGCAWGRSEHNALWARAIQQIANSVRQPSGQTILIHLRRYPLIILGYAASLAALSRHNFQAMKAVTIDAQARMEGGRIPIIGAMHTGRPFQEFETPAQLLALEAENAHIDEKLFEDLRTGRTGRRHTPVSNRINHVLRPFFRNLIADDEDYEEAFDELEIYLGALATDAYLRGKTQNLYLDGPWYGQFTWRHRYWSDPPEVAMKNRATEEGSAWAPLKGNLFQGSIENAQQALEEFNKGAAQARSNRF